MTSTDNVTPKITITNPNDDALPARPLLDNEPATQGWSTPPGSQGNYAAPTIVVTTLNPAALPFRMPGRNNTASPLTLIELNDDAHPARPLSRNVPAAQSDEDENDGRDLTSSTEPNGSLEQEQHVEQEGTEVGDNFDTTNIEPTNLNTSPDLTANVDGEAELEEPGLIDGNESIHLEPVSGGGPVETASDGVTAEVLDASPLTLNQEVDNAGTDLDDPEMGLGNAKATTNTTTDDEDAPGHQESDEVNHPGWMDENSDADKSDASETAANQQGHEEDDSEGPRLNSNAELDNPDASADHVLANELPLGSPTPPDGKTDLSSQSESDEKIEPQGPDNMNKNTDKNDKEKENIDKLGMAKKMKNPEKSKSTEPLIDKSITDTGVKDLTEGFAGVKISSTQSSNEPGAIHEDGDHQITQLGPTDGALEDITARNLVPVADVDLDTLPFSARARRLHDSFLWPGMHTAS